MDINSSRRRAGMMKRKESDPIIAAGGIVRGQESNAGRIALVRRSRYGGDVSLPKGKMESGEDLQSTALREVKEETGYETKIVDYGGTTHYRVKGRPKAVTYFIMDALPASQPGPLDRKEIDLVEWLSPTNAISKLTHQEDRALISAIFGLSRAQT
jgi:8-oxo-dGTP pyrophosphatase MutT (NUDIX family)